MPHSGYGGYMAFIALVVLLGVGYMLAGGIGILLALILFAIVAR